MFDFNSIYVFCNYLLTGFFNGTPDSLHPLQTSAVSTFQKKSDLRLVRTKPIYKKLPFAFWLRNALHNSWEEGCNERGSMQKGRCTNTRAIKRYKRNILSWSCRISFSPFFNLKGTFEMRIILPLFWWCAKTTDRKKYKFKFVKIVQFTNYLFKFTLTSHTIFLLQFVLLCFVVVVV